MRSRLWKSAVAAFGAGSALALLAVSGASAEPAAPRAGGTTLNIAVQAGAPEVAIYEKLSQAWETQTGNKINWVQIPQSSMHDQLVTSFSSKSGSYDAIGLNQQWVAQFGAAGYMEPLTKKLSAKDKKDFYAADLAGMSYGKQLYGIPHYMFAPVLYYRTDLFKKYGLRIPTLSKPLTKAEFLKDARILNQNGVSGTIVEGKNGVVAATHFQEYIYREGGTIVDSKGKAHVNSAAAVRALTFMVNLVRKYEVAPAGALGFDNTDNLNLFTQGKLGMAINFPYAYSITLNPAASQVSNDFAVTLPFKAAKTTSILGGNGVGIPADAPHKAAAWSWIKFITSTKQLYNLRKQSFAPPARASELKMLEADPAVSDSQKAALKVMVQAEKNAVLVPQVPQYSAISTRLSVALGQALGGQATPKQALDSAQSDINQLLNQ